MCSAAMYLAAMYLAARLAARLAACVAACLAAMADHDHDDNDNDDAAAAKGCLLVEHRDRLPRLSEAAAEKRNF